MRSQTKPKLTQSNIQLACQAGFQQFNGNRNCQLTAGTKPNVVSEASMRDHPFRLPAGGHVPPPLPLSSPPPACDGPPLPPGERLPSDSSPGGGGGGGIGTVHKHWTAQKTGGNN